MGIVAGNVIATMLMGATLFGQGMAAPSMPPAKASTESTRTRPVRRSSAGDSYLGVDLRNLTAERASELKLAGASGVEITMVDQDAPAGKAGLREHDVVLSFDGRKAENAEALRRQIRATPPGRSVALSIVRAGQPVNLTVQLASRKQMLASPGSRPLQPPPMHPPISSDLHVPQLSIVPFWARNGLIVEDLTPQLGDFFGVRNGNGVLVRSVERGSYAETAGLRAGDVIVKINNEQVTCSSDWRHIMRRQKAGPVTLGIVRDKREQSLTMKLPEPGTGSLRIDLPNLAPALEEMRAEWEHMRPQIERSIQIAQSQAMRAVEDAMREALRHIEQARQEQERSRQGETPDR